MKIYIMTDLEGVAGVLNFEDWCAPSSRYYETAKKFLTLEVNAAIDGFFDGGATEVVVADGHGWGGVNIDLLDPRADMMRGWSPGPYPVGLDSTFAGVAWIGQHPKAGTEYGHLCHTQGFDFIDLSINGISVGEFGQVALCANELGVRPIFGSGDRAFTLEAQALTPGIETVAVKYGLTPGSGDEASEYEYERRNMAAVHVQPVRACAMIREGAKKAMKLAGAGPYHGIDISAPYERIARFRNTDKEPKRIAKATHPSSVIGVMNEKWILREMMSDE